MLAGNLAALAASTPFPLEEQSFHSHSRASFLLIEVLPIVNRGVIGLINLAADMLIAVSYTHLDVYKRQRVHRSITVAR